VYFIGHVYWIERCCKLCETLVVYYTLWINIPIFLLFLCPFTFNFTSITCLFNLDSRFFRAFFDLHKYITLNVCVDLRVLECETGVGCCTTLINPVTIWIHRHVSRTNITQKTSTYIVIWILTFFIFHNSKQIHYSSCFVILFYML